MRYLGVMGLALLALLALVGSASATVLTSPKGTPLGVGTEIKASAGATTLDGVTGISCSNSALEGKVSNAGGEGATVKVEPSKWTFTGCGNHTYEMLKPGTLEIHGLENGNGTLTSTGTELTVLTHSLFLGTRHCIYGTNNTHIGVITSSSTTGGTAKLTVDSSQIPVVGTPGEICGESAEWTGSYSFGSPDYLDVDAKGNPKPEPGTILTSPKGTELGVGTEIEAESAGATSFDGTINTSCNKSALGGKVTNAGGEGAATVKIELSKFTFTECGNHTYETIKPGALEVHALENGNGTLTSTGTEFTILTHSLFLGTRHCIYRTNATHIGTISGSSTTGGTAKLSVDSSQIPVVGTSGEICGATAEWTGSYSFNKPDYLDSDGTLPSGTTLTSPKGTELGIGAEIKAESEGGIEFAGSVPVSCGKATMEGEISSTGGLGGTVVVPLSKQTLTECGSHTVEVKKPGSLEIHTSGATANGNGTLTSTGAEITVLTHSVFLGTRHCIYRSSNSDIGTITGSSTTGGTATLDIGPVATGQSATDGTCGSAEWGGSYKITSPDYLDVD